MHSCRSSRWSLTSSLPRHSTGVSTDTKHGRSGGSGCVGRRRLYGDPALHHAPSEWRASSARQDLCCTCCEYLLVPARAVGVCSLRLWHLCVQWVGHSSVRFRDASARAARGRSDGALPGGGGGAHGHPGGAAVVWRGSVDLALVRSAPLPRLSSSPVRTLLCLGRGVQRLTSRLAGLGALLCGGSSSGARSRVGSAAMRLWCGAAAATGSGGC